MLSNLWRRTKEVAKTYTLTFIVIMLLNQLLFFGFCLDPICLVAAMPHVLFITVAIGSWLNNISNWGRNKTDKVNPTRTRTDPQVLLSSLSKEQQQNIEATPKNGQKWLTGHEHYDYLVQSLKQTKKQLIILSGWLNNHVIDGMFLEHIEAKLNKGIKVYIGYGYQDWNGEHKTTDSYDIALDSLKKLISKYPEQLIIAKYATHEKLLVVDEQVVVYGSANWLSNKNYRNSERSVVIENEKSAKMEAKRVRTLILSNLIAH